MYGLSQEAVSGEYQPLLGFAGIGVSMFTGVGPLKHGVWTEFWRNEETSPFRWTTKTSMANSFVDAVAEMGRVGHLAKSGITHVTFKVSNRICGRTYVPMARGIPQNRLHFFDTTLPFDLFDQHYERTLSIPTIVHVLHHHDVLFRVLSESRMKDPAIFAEALHVDKNASLVFMQFSGIDKVGHATGPYSHKTHQMLSKIDSMVREVIEKHREYLDTDVCIFSDHGMSAVTKIVDPLRHLQKAGMKEGKDYLAFLDSTLARFWSLTPDAEDRIIAAMKMLDGGHILSPQELVQYQIPDDKRYGEVIWLADFGSLVLPNYYQGSRRALGMHGYAPEGEESCSPFIIHGNETNPRKVKQLAKPVDIFSTLLDLLHLPIPEYAEGQSLLAVS